MSETEVLKGTLKQFGRTPEESFADYVLRFIKLKNAEIPESYLSPDAEIGISDANAEELFGEVFWKEGGVIIDQVIYEILEIGDHEFEDIFEAKRQGDGTIDFILKYCNGGCSFGEALGYAFDKMKERE